MSTNISLVSAEQGHKMFPREGHHWEWARSGEESYSVHSPDLAFSTTETPSIRNNHDVQKVSV